MINRLKEQWSKLPAERKRVVVVSTVVGLVLIFSVVSYYVTRLGKETVPQKTADVKKEISLEPKLLEKTYMAESAKQLEALRQELDAAKKLIEEEKKAKEVEEAKQKTVTDKASSQMPSASLPPPPPPAPSVFASGPNGQVPVAVPPPPGVQTAVDKPASAVEVLGDIEVVSHQPKVQSKVEEKTEDKKKGGKKIYLPPSFMEATLLSGLDAPAVGVGKGNPVPVLLRVKDIAVLPNRVKANLKGCFVIADGTGSLADERAHLRLVSLSCVTKNGQSVIDQAVKGFVVDEDGKIGLRGKVVSKMGSAIARSFVAGMFGGLGEAIRASQLTTVTTAVGTTQTLSNGLGDIATAGIGGGLAASMQEIQRFYLELARQAIPVIEVGATKTVTLVISEGVELNIKDFKDNVEAGGK